MVKAEIKKLFSQPHSWYLLRNQQATHADQALQNLNMSVVKDAPTCLSSEIPIVETHRCLGPSGSCRILKAKIYLFDVLPEEAVWKGNHPCASALRTVME